MGQVPRLGRQGVRGVKAHHPALGAWRNRGSGQARAVSRPPWAAWVSTRPGTAPRNTTRSVRCDGIRPVSAMPRAASIQRNAAQGSGRSTGSATVQASKGTEPSGADSNWPSAKTVTSGAARASRAGTPQSVRACPVARHDHDRRAMGLERIQRRLGQCRVAQALRLDEARQDVLGQRIAMGLLLFGLAHGLLVGVQRVASGRTGPRRREIRQRHLLQRRRARHRRGTSAP